MSRHLGDYAASTVIYGKFTTFRPSTGAAFTLGGTPALSVYKDNSTTQSTVGVTLTADFDGVTGLNHFAIDTSADGTFYSAGSNFDVVITTGTVDSVSVVGSVVASFSIAKDSALKPTVAGRTLDVSTGGEAGLDWANVGGQATSVTLSSTTVGTITTYTGNTPQTGDSFARIGSTGSGLTSLASQASVNAIDDFIDTEIADIQNRLPAALVSGKIDASLGAIASSVTVPAGAIPFLGIVDNGTAQSATSTTLVARAAAPDNSIQAGMTLMAYGSTQGYWQSVIIDSVSGDTYTIAAWPLATPSGTITYYVQGTPNGSPNLLPSVNVTHAAGTAWNSGAIVAGTIATGAIDADALAADAGTEIFNAVVTSQLTESYAADNTAPTLAQALFMIQQMLTEKSVSSTTLTVKKLDGSTTAATFTLNDGTNPTSITRTT